MNVRWIIAVACLSVALPAALCQDAPGEEAAIVEVAPVPAPVTESAPATPAQNQPSEQKSFGPLPAFAFPKGTKVEDRGLIWRMNHYMAGQRVISTGYGEFRDDIDWSDEDFKREPTLIGKLQMVCAKQSPREGDLIPFKVGGSYVVAPEMREQASTDLSKMSEFDLSSRGLLIDEVLLGLSAGQLSALGSDNGIPVSSLPADVQARIQRAFRPPLRILSFTDSTYKSEDGMEHASLQQDEKGNLVDPIDWSTARVRARLAVSGVFVDLQPYGVSVGQRGQGLRFEQSESRQNSWDNRGVDLPIFSDVPNTFKPSDLTGKAYKQPLNAAGLWTVGEVVQRLQKATGLRLYTSGAFKDRAVFIGSNAVTVGETIDGLRLSLTGAWRKLGNAYILAWDRLGVQTIQQLTRESAEAVSKSIRKRKQSNDTDVAWVRVAENLPFDPADPLALDSTQRQRIFGLKADDKPWRTPDAMRIKFEDMTPDQQAWVRAAAAKDSVQLPGPPPGGAEIKRPFTDEDLSKAYIQGDCRIDFCVQVPGVGWVRNAESWDGARLSPYMVAQARAKLSSDGTVKKRNLIDELPAELRDLVDHPKPSVPPAPIRALMVPPIGSARLAVLADEMKRHGLNTLFYPVLFDGYATFPSKAFGPHPALRGADGWAAAVAAMKPAGINVVGYFNTLAWQEAGDNTHYLSKHRDWLDVDVVGRGRLEWFESHPSAISSTQIFGVSAANYVRPLEPAVSAKLQILTDEFAHKPGSIGICFTEWRPSSVPALGGPFSSAAAPALGYALADRIAELNRTGEDPVDRIQRWDDYIPRALQESRYDMYRGDQSKTPSPHVALVNDLLKRAKAARKDWKTWVVTGMDMGDMMRPDPGAASKIDADETVNSVFGSIMGGAGKMGVLMPIGKGNFLSSLAEEELGNETEVPDSLKRMPAIATYSLFFSAMAVERPGAGAPSFSSVIYDFRTAPDEITPSLQWVKAPDKDSAAKAPAKAGARAPAPASGAGAVRRAVPR